MQKIELFKGSEATHTFAPGEYVFREGDAGNAAYVVLEGEAEVLIKDLVVEHAGPGSLLGEMALIEALPRSASVRSKTSCKLMAVDERRFRFLVQQHPFFALQVMKIMAERLRSMNQTNPA